MVNQAKTGPLGAMQPFQRELATALLAAGLSQQGVIKAQSIMSLEQVLLILEGAKPANRRDPDNYFITIFGIPSRLVKIFMRRDCSIGVGRQDVLDSGCHVADRAQAEQGQGRAARCSCLGGCVLRDNALGTG